MENVLEKESTMVQLENLSANQLPELQGWKDTQLQIVESNPFVKIKDHKTYEEAKKARTALVSARTTKEEQERKAKEEAERIEAEKRAKALKPEKEKLLAYFKEIKAPFEVPELKDESLVQLMGQGISKVEELRESLIEQLSKL